MDRWVRLIQAYATHQRGKNLAQRTIDERRQLILALARETGRSPGKVTTLDLQVRLGRRHKRKPEKGLMPSTMQRERSDMRNFFKWAKKEGHISKNPAKRLSKISVPRTAPRPMTMGQVQLVLSSGAYRRTRTMILLAVYQGLRAHEIAKFRGDHIDYTSGTILVLGKGGKERSVPMDPVIRAEAETYPQGYWFPSRKTNTKGHVHHRSVSDLMTRAIRRAGITDPRITGHSMRHTYGTELVEAGVDIRVVQELMRHDSLNSTQIYTRVSEKRKREAQLLLPRVSVPTASGRLAA